MRRPAKIICMWAVAGMAAGCHLDSTPFCFGIEGPCTGPAAPMTYIVGFDPGSVDMSTTVNGGYRAVLHVGQSATLRLAYSATGDVVRPTDTLRTVSWVLTDSTAATLTPLPDGGARLDAKVPGRVGAIRGNGYSGTYACGPAGCSFLTQVDVVAP